MATNLRCNDTGSSNIKYYSYEIVYDFLEVDNYPDDVVHILEDIYERISRFELSKALDLITNALAKYPDVPTLYHYRFVLHKFLNDPDLEAIAREFYEKFPEYFYTRIDYARVCLENGKMDEIPAIFNEKYELQSLYPDRNKFHIDEVVLFHGIMARYFILVNKLDLAVKYVELLSQLNSVDVITEEVLDLFNQTIFTSNAESLAAKMPFASTIELLNHPLSFFPAIIKLLNSPAEASQLLLDLIDYRVSNHEEILLGQRDYIFALYLLAQFKDQRAFPYIVRFMQFPMELREDLFGDVITEGFTKLLISTFNGNVDLIKQIIENDSAYEFARKAALDSLLGLFALEKIARDEIIAYLKRIYPIFSGDPLLAAIWVEASSSLYAQDLFGDIMDLFDNNMVDSDYIGYETVLQFFSLGTNACLKSNVYENTLLRPVQDILKDPLLSAWFDWDEVLGDGGRFGRNDACPCGSNKKYKKCCLILIASLSEGFMG